MLSARVRRWLIAIVTLTVFVGQTALADVVTLPSGLRLAFRETGSGPRTMVMIHGWGFSQAIWDRVFDRAPRGWRIVSFDLRGFGDSSQPADGYDYATLVTDLHDFLAARQIARATLAGHSFGAWFLQDFAAAYPEMVEALVLTSPQPRTLKLSPPEPIQKLIDAVGPEQDRKAFFDANIPRYFAPGVLSAADAAHFVANGMKAAPQALQGTLRAALAADPIPIQTFALDRYPVMTVLGTHDIVTLAAARQLAQDFKGSCTAIVERAGHVSMWERPERWMEHVFDFLGGPGGGRRC